MAQNGPCIDWLSIKNSDLHVLSITWINPNNFQVISTSIPTKTFCALLESPQSFALSAALWGSSFPTSHAVASRRGKTWGRCRRPQWNDGSEFSKNLSLKGRVINGNDPNDYATSTHSRLEEMEFQFVTRSSGKIVIVDWGCGQCLCVQGLLVQHDPTVQVTLTQRLQAPGCKHISKRNERNISMIRWNKKYAAPEV